MTFAVVRHVPRRDFFSFCTTLRPIELKALGELSHVRHLQKGELIYTTGELAEEVYSVNRGVVEVIQLNQVRAGKGPGGSQKLSGSLANVDLITVHQTIISSGPTGELEVLNEHNERIATFYFQGGALRSGQFQQLTGEEAFWQLFLSD